MNAYQTAGFAYQGAGQFAYQEGGGVGEVARLLNPMVASVLKLMNRR